MHANRSALDAWDARAWAQALNALDALRAAWDARARQAAARIAQGGHYLGALEGSRLAAVEKDATHNVGE